MLKPASSHTSLIFIFGSLNFKSPQQINTGTVPQKADKKARHASAW